jgi:hypothetical protein
MKLLATNYRQLENRAAVLEGKTTYVIRIRWGMKLLSSESYCLSGLKLMVGFESCQMLFAPAGVYVMDGT